MHTRHVCVVSSHLRAIVFLPVDIQHTTHLARAVHTLPVLFVDPREIPGTRYVIQALVEVGIYSKWKSIEMTPPELIRL